MPRLLKEILPVNRNPLLQIDNKILAVVEYAGLSYMLDQRGITGGHKFLATIIIGGTYEYYILQNYKRGNEASHGIDPPHHSDPFIKTRV